MAKTPFLTRARRGAAPALLLAVVVLQLLVASPAAAHGFSTTVYVDLTSPSTGVVRAELGLEYDLLVTSGADAEHDDALFREGDAAFRDSDTAAQQAALAQHADAVVAYVTQRLTVRTREGACPATPEGAFRIDQREGVPYAELALEFHCAAAASSHELRSALFPDSEEYVRGAKTIVTYDLDLRSGTAALDGGHSSFSTDQSTAHRFWEFFRLGTEHLLTGPDHLLFLLALIAGSRRLREVVLAASSFTLAHSVTFILAALGVVDVPPSVVEPTIALSIAVVAAWHLWMLFRRGDRVTELSTRGHGHLSLDKAGWGRLAVVFCFGLVHGLGFAGALGINAAFSWQLLWSLLVFNVGIETVQLGLIALAFPLLMLLRSRSSFAGRWTTGGISSGVTVMGLIWFIGRVSV